MTLKEAQDKYKENGKPITCLRDLLPFRGIWLQTDGYGNPDFNTLTDEERQALKLSKENQQ